MQEPLIYLHVGQYHKTEQLCQSLKKKIQSCLFKRGWLQHWTVGSGSCMLRLTRSLMGPPPRPQPTPTLLSPQMHKPKSTFALFQHFAELVLHQSKRCIHSGKVPSEERAIAGIVSESKQEEKFRVTEVWNWEKLDAVSAETGGGRVDFRSFSFRPSPFLVIKKACTVRVWRRTVSVTTTCFKNMLNNQIRRGVRSYAQCSCNVLAKFWCLVGCFKRLDW